MNPSPMKIVVGIPSYNEGDSISYVVKQVDMGLRKYFPTAKSLIVNVDSNSQDNTKKAFSETKTYTPKKYLNKGTVLRGKGKNLIELFKYCNRLHIDYIAVFDSDIKSIKPSWVRSLLNPLVSKKFDYTTPVYSRGCYDGNVTNNFACPMTYAIFDENIQQPIGGDFGFNKRLYKYLLKQKIDDAVLGFGIDIFITFHALGGGFRICEAYLGEKVHKPGFHTLMDKFVQFSQSAIKVSRLYNGKLVNIKPIKRYKSILVTKTKNRPDEKIVSAQRNRYRAEFKKNLINYYKYLGKNLTDRMVKIILIGNKPLLSSVDWIKALARFLNICYEEKFKVESTPRICHLIGPIFFWRVISFWEEVENLNPIGINNKIASQAIMLKNQLAR